MQYRLFAIACLATITACSEPVPQPPGNAVLYVAQRGWHTDITLPVDAIEGPLATLERGLPGVRFLTFGFGERQFLVHRQETFAAMLNALLPSQSALLLTALKATPAEAYGSRNVVALHVSSAALQRIEARLWQEFEHSPAGEPIVLADGPYPGSTFYAASDTYSGLFTCNTWTADMLRTGGLAVPGAGVLFAGQVMGTVRWIAARQAASVPD